MTLLTLAVLAALAAALACAAQLGGALGGGVVLGYLLGAGLSGLAFLYQRHVLVTRPERALTALVVGFLAKLAALVLAALAFRYVDAAAQRADWRSFVIAYGAAVALVVPLATWTAVQDQRRRGAARAAKTA